MTNHLGSQKGLNSARDLSIKRAQLADIPIILGSATPSLQTLKLVKENKFIRVDIPNRVDGNKPPKLIALDINNSPLIGGVAKETIEAMQSTIDRGEQVLVFINRRGFAPLYQCGSCGWVADCKSCDTNLVFHQARNRLICHRCESAYSVNCLVRHVSLMTLICMELEQRELKKFLKAAL